MDYRISATDRIEDTRTLSAGASVRNTYTLNSEHASQKDTLYRIGIEFYEASKPKPVSMSYSSRENQVDLSTPSPEPLYF